MAKTVRRHESKYYDDSYPDQKLEEGYFSSQTPMDGYELAERIKVPGQMKGTKDGRYRTEDTYSYVYKKDAAPEQTPPQAEAPDEPEAAPAEPTPVKDSPEIQSAKERAINYKSGLSISVPDETTDVSSSKAADSFLNNKKMKFSDTLNLQ